MLNVKKNVPLGYFVLILIQASCAAFFLVDVLSDLSEHFFRPSPHIIIEGIAVVALVAGIIIETKFLVEIYRRKVKLENSLKIANAAIFDVIEACFIDWKLSPSETDIANLLVKGFSIDEIAELRGNKPGTIKAHLNNIYRKSDTRNRAEFMSSIIDTLVTEKPETVPEI
jgi:DNA-binding NarL/FixJ family response regulator